MHKKCIRECRGLSKAPESDLINLLHPGGILGISLQRRHVHVVGSSVLHVAIVVLDPESELDHPVDALRVDLGILEAEPRGEEAGLEQEHHQVLH